MLGYMHSCYIAEFVEHFKYCDCLGSSGQSASLPPALFQYVIKQTHHSLSFEKWHCSTVKVFWSCTLLLFIAKSRKTLLMEYWWLVNASSVVNGCGAVFPRATCTVLKILWKKAAQDLSHATVGAFSSANIFKSLSSFSRPACASHRQTHRIASPTPSKA